MISTHILDLQIGKPAAGIDVSLQQKNKSQWIDIEKGTTNVDGRFIFTREISEGTLRITFAIEKYFDESFFSDAEISFKVTDVNKKYHIPLLLSPFGYSTYRGS